MATKRGKAKGAKRASKRVPQGIDAARIVHHLAASGASEADILDMMRRVDDDCRVSDPDRAFVFDTVKERDEWLQRIVAVQYARYQANPDEVPSWLNEDAEIRVIPDWDDLIARAIEQGGSYDEEHDIIHPPQRMKDAGIFLAGYIHARSQVEGKSSELDSQWFTAHILNGCRNFFGVELDDECMPIYDSQEPRTGYFDACYRQWCGE